MSGTNVVISFAPILTAIVGIATILTGGDLPGTRTAWTTLAKAEATQSKASPHALAIALMSSD